LRSDVQLTAEQVILQVSDFSTKIIEKIDEYEKELVEFNKTNSESLETFNVIYIIIRKGAKRNFSLIYLQNGRIRKWTEILFHCRLLSAYIR
jgi:hypothetical protein